MSIETDPSRTEEDATLEPTQDAPASDARATLLNSLRAKREELKKDHYLDLDLPGYEGMLVARFRPFPLEKQERKMAEFQRASGKQPILLKAACDTLIDACEQLMLRKERDGDPFPIDEEAMPAIAFDNRAAELFGFSAQSARQVVIGMFPTEQAILAMNVRVSQWMQDVTRETDEALLGN